MSAGTRWNVMEQVPRQELAELDRRLLEWLERTLSSHARSASGETS